MVNADLGELEALWVFAHELGHEYTNHEYDLFSSEEVLKEPKRKRHEKNWQRPRSRKAHEEAASLWAAQQLVTSAEWRWAEGRFPCCLRAMAQSLDLHPQALFWASKVFSPIRQTGQVRLTAATEAALAKPNNPKAGGHQGLIGRIQNCQNGNQLALTRELFNRLREYHLNGAGGFGGRYQLLLKDIQCSIVEQGGILLFFKSSRTRPVAVPKGVGYRGEQLSLL